jgi:hypothetical protein
MQCDVLLQLTSCVAGTDHQWLFWLQQLAAVVQSGSGLCLLHWRALLFDECGFPASVYQYLVHSEGSGAFFLVLATWLALQLSAQLSNAVV